MVDKDEARARFEAIAKGRYAHGKLSPEEAKARLREVDPGLDVSRVLQALDVGDLKRAGRALAIEVAAARAVAYFYPLAIDAAQLIIDLIPKKR